MKQLRFFTLTAAAAFLLAVAAPSARAQVSVGVQIGSPPDCPYGYFDYAPYDCAPIGYYGPQWFPNGVFVGAGPWYHGDEDDFHGWVNRHYDPRYGYRGELPPRGERPDWDRHRGWERDFHGDYERQEVRHVSSNHYGQDDDDHRGGRNNGQYNRGNGRDDGNYNGQYGDRGRGRDNGNYNGQYGDRGRGRDNDNGQYNNRGNGRDNGNYNGQYNNRGNGRDDDNRNGQYNNNRGGSYDNGHGSSRDNGHGHGHDDDGH